MAFFRILPLLLVLGFAGYAVWDLKIDVVTGPPVPADQLAGQDEGISRAMAQFRAPLAQGDIDATIKDIEASLSVIEREFGANSPEHIQGLSEAAILLSRAGVPDQGEQFMRRAADEARITFTPQHRETALILHDLANLKIANADNGTDPEAIDILREVVATRRAILGPDHEETRGAEISLADALFSAWIVSDEDADSLLLSEAEALVERPVVVDAADNEYALLQARGDRLLYGRILFAQERYGEALTIYDETLTSPEETTNPQIYLVLATVYSEQIMALRHLGRGDEADTLHQTINEQIQSAAAAEPPETR